MKLIDIIKMILSGKGINLSGTIENVDVEYKDAEKGEDENGNLKLTMKKKTKSINPKRVILGLQKKSDNMDDKDSSTAANVSLAEATTIAYPIYQLWEEIEELKKRIKRLESL